MDLVELSNMEARPSELTDAELAAEMKEALGGWYFSGRCTLSPILHEVVRRLTAEDPE